MPENDTTGERDDAATCTDVSVSADSLSRSESVQRLPEIIDLAQLPGVACPCGTARRAFADREDFPGTVHLTQIEQSAKTHYHTEHTEVYVILSCDKDAAMELDGKLHPVRPKCTILIPPGTRHRAVGKMEVLIVCLPKFDSRDEHFD